MPEYPMAAAMEKTISEAVRQGIVDPELHAAPIEAMRVLAERADEGNAHDNVTLPTLLKYLSALGIVMEPAKPAKAERQAEEPKKPEGKLSRMRSGRGVNLRAIS